MPEKSEHFLTTYVTLKDNVNEADRIKFKDSSSPTQKNKTDDGKDASEVEQSETNDKCSAPTDAEDSQLLQNGRELKQNICDEIQLESQNLQPVDAVSSSSLEGTVTGNDQSEALSFDSSCFDETNGDVLVINDSDNENGEQERHGRSRKTKWRPVLKRDLYPVVEHLQLSLEEESLGLSYLWNHFCDVQKTFLPNYIAYHHFRSKGWVPKSGLKFGCDFILYREGPPFYHGSYSVVVRLVDEQTLQDSTYHNTRCLSWTSLSGLNRITEHVAKELLICYVIKPRDITPERLASPKCILDFSVQEVHVSRWISSQEREKKEEEEFP
ncbi:tRNA-splicing endonuclease subunit Sen2-like [Gigantopelta aegis]|uniref:tRNA-splicing endonuclease subunit Sen2-like n=1 Tax=Gigantopelta aegis TaxID=1735272 RepID=UPI001B888EA2|nr:tRNA-splicing endonuclease subunit Sen2-like [Gigantopelta aegis]